MIEEERGRKSKKREDGGRGRKGRKRGGREERRRKEGGSKGGREGRWVGEMASAEATAASRAKKSNYARNSQVW